MRHDWKKAITNLELWAMFALVILFLTVVAYGCSATLDIPAKKRVFLDPKPTMTYEQIRSAFKNYKYQDARDTPEDIKRKKQLVNMDKLIPPQAKVQKRAKASKYLVAANDVVDLRKHCTKVETQDNGKCTVYALLKAVECTINKKAYFPGLDLSDWHQWENQGKQYSVFAAVKSLKSKKICDESLYPQYGKKSSACEKTRHAFLKKARYIGGDIHEAVSSIARGNYVYVGMPTPVEMYRCNTIITPNSGFTSGGHAVILTGHDKKGKYFIMRNSWGVGCGDNGDQYISEKTLEVAAKKYVAMWEIIDASATRRHKRWVCDKKFLWWKWKCTWR